MKPTDEERREVAENLRNMCCCGCRYAEQFYELLPYCAGCGARVEGAAK